MTRTTEGKLALSPTILFTIIAAALSVGSGGTWALADRADASGQVVALSDKINSNATTIARLEERDKAREERLVRIEKLVEKIDGKLDRVLRQ